jgi:hypothetical protein
VKPQEEKKKEIFDSAHTSVLTYLQVPMELHKIQETLEQAYIQGLKRAYGLSMIS